MSVLTLPVQRLAIAHVRRRVAYTQPGGCVRVAIIKPCFSVAIGKKATCVYFRIRKWNLSSRLRTLLDYDIP